ncbi:MAG: hypothetical protein GY696_08480 [Gammaproteobacteria bacterium]|nr:hypothetical protein [Gammaproteobacteria bacterium]
MNAQKKLKQLNRTEEMEKELRALKQEFEDAPIQVVPFQLTTDFSMKAISAILSQVQDGQERLIAAMGRETTDTKHRSSCFGIRKFQEVQDQYRLVCAQTYEIPQQDDQCVEQLDGGVSSI